MNGQLMWCGWACVYCQVKGKKSISQAINEYIGILLLKKITNIFNLNSKLYLCLLIFFYHYILIH